MAGERTGAGGGVTPVCGIETTDDNDSDKEKSGVLCAPSSPLPFPATTGNELAWRNDWGYPRTFWSTR